MVTTPKAILHDVKQAIRHPFAWPGGYPVYVVLADGEELCGTCARTHYRLIAAATKDQLSDGWRAVGAEIKWEGDDDLCGHCGAPLQSAYGDPQ